MGAVVLSLDLLEVAVSLEVDDPTLAAQFSALLRGFGPAASPRHRLRLAAIDGVHRLYDGNRLLRDDMSGPGALNVVLWTLNQLALTTTAYAVVHAGCVARGDRGLVLAAPSGGGKSTLVAALVERGWDYLSDEFAAISLDDGRVRPYPSPLRLKAGSFSLFPHLRPPPWEVGDPERWDLPSERLGARRWQPVMVHALVLGRYVPGAPCQLRSLDPLGALREIVGACLNLDRLADEAFPVLAAWIQSVDAYQLTYGDMEEATETVGTVVAAPGGRSTATSQWPARPAGAKLRVVVATHDVTGKRRDARRRREERAMAVSGSMPTSLLSPAPCVVSARVGEEVMVFHREARRIDCLDPYASIVWDLCDGTRDVEGVVAEIASAAEVDHHDVSSRVEAAVARFRELGLLR